MRMYDFGVHPFSDYGVLVGAIALIGIGFATGIWLGRYGSTDKCRPSTPVENLEIIGQGACGTVFRTVKKVKHKYISVALKHIFNPRNPDEILHLLSQLKILSEHCPHVLKLVDYQFVPAPHRYIAIYTEFCEEGTLGSLAKKGQMDSFRLYDCLVQALNGLCFLHSHGIIHRDIKGDNVLLTKKGGSDFVKIGDLDFSRLLERANSESCSVTGGTGTVAFMAPEVIQGSAGDAHIGRKADTWSFACMVVELASGGELRYYRRRNGGFVDRKCDKFFNLEWEIANGAFPELNIQSTTAENLILLTFFEELLQSCWRPAFVATGQFGDNETRPSSHELLLRFTHKVCRKHGTAGFPSVLDYSHMGMMLLKPWVRDRVSCLQSVYNNIDTKEKFLYLSAYEWKDTIPVDRASKNSDGVIVCCEELDCLVSIVVEEVFETTLDESAGLQGGKKDPVPWLSMLALCRFHKGDPLHPDDVASFFDILPREFPRTNDLHNVLRLRCRLGISTCDPKDVLPARGTTDFEQGRLTLSRGENKENRTAVAYGASDLLFCLDPADSTC